MTWRETLPNEYIRYDVARNYLHDACRYMGGDGGLDIKCRFDSENTTTIPHWIPVTERLPEEDGEYITTVETCDGLFVTSFVTSNDWRQDKQEWGFWTSDERFYEGWCRAKNVVAWMKLPEPYREGEQNENN